MGSHQIEKKAYDKKCHNYKSDRYERRLEHHTRRTPIGAPYIAEARACTFFIKAARRKSRHIDNSSAVIDLGYLFLFLLLFHNSFPLIIYHPSKWQAAQWPLP